MRGYKVIIFLAISLYAFSFIAFNFIKLKKTDIINNSFLAEQLNIERGAAGTPGVLVYGSSGALFGLSADALKRTFDMRTINMSTVGSGGQFGRFFELISNVNPSGKVLVLSDRNYRKEKIEKERYPFKFSFTDVSFLVNLQVLFVGQMERNSVGDKSNYSTYAKNFFPPEIRIPVYSSTNLNLIRSHIDSTLKLGMCPVIAYMPLFVDKTSVASHVAATDELNALVRDAGVGQYVAFIPMIESDKSLFSDSDHMSELGREKWTRLLSAEIVRRNMCGISHAPSSKSGS